MGIEELAKKLKEHYAAMIVAEFAAANNEDIIGARYRIGERVQVVNVDSNAVIATGTVIGVGETGFDGYEYAVDGYGFLVYEDELQPASEA